MSMSAPHTFRVGTRGSPLALRQTGLVLDALRRVHPDTQFSIKTIKTTGDKGLPPPGPLPRGSRGLFVKEIEEALLAGEVDLAIHSLKDLPTELPQGLALGAIPEREEPRDALVTRWGLPLARLPYGSRLGTSSPRRLAQLRVYRRDLDIVPLRGNIDTRLHKAEALDGIVVAAAGLLRLGLSHRITQLLSPDICLPAVGQGALAVEVRAWDEIALALVAPADHAPTRAAVTAERAFLGALGGGCAVPIGALAQVQDSRLSLQGVVASPDGKRLVSGSIEADVGQPEDAGERLATLLLEQGAREILAGGQG